jgi:hypothetical protein
MAVTREGDDAGQTAEVQQLKAKGRSSDPCRSQLLLGCAGQTLEQVKAVEGE